MDENKEPKNNDKNSEDDIFDEIFSGKKPIEDPMLKFMISGDPFDKVFKQKKKTKKKGD
jgi:hypothetical protein